MALISHWQRNPVQLLSYLAGLAMATALWSGVQAINVEARASYDKAAMTLGEGQYDLLHPKQGESLSLENYVFLRKAGWLVSPVIDGKLGDVRLVGMDPLTLPNSFAAANISFARSMIELEQSDTLFTNEETALKLPSNVKVTLDPSVGPGLAVGDISLVQRLLKSDRLTRLIILPMQPIKQGDLDTIAPNLRLEKAQQLSDVTKLTDSFHLNLTAFGLLSFAVGLFIVHSTIGLAFEQRRAMIRTMRAMGVPLRTLFVLVNVEMLILAMIGAMIGIVFGYLIAAFLLPDVAATLSGLYGAEISGTLQFRADWWLSGLLLAIAGTAIALSSHMWQITKMPLLESARPRAWVIARTSKFRIQSAVAITLLFAAILMVMTLDGLLVGFALLGSLLIGAALALPSFTAGSLTLLQKYTTAPIWSWFWADTRQQLPGLSLALMALLLAVSANIGVSTMVSSFRLTFVGFLDQRLAPELFMRVNSAEQSKELETFLKKRDVEVLPLLSTQVKIEQHFVELFGIRVGQTYRNNWVFLEATTAAWDEVQLGQAIIVNEQLARRTNLWVGDRVQIRPNLKLPIAAVVGDYGNPKGQVIITEKLFQEINPGLFPDRFGVRTQDASELRAQIIDKTGMDDTAIIDQASIKAFSLEVFERTFLVTSALNILTLGVASFAILMSLLTLADLRVPQLAPVWALGLTRSQLARLEILRTILLAAFVVLCAIPTGLTLAWILLSVINVKAFGWKLPMYLFPLEYAKLGVYALVAAFLAAAWPTLRLIRTPPSTLLKVFASER
jgi:putative ABC transport system permease protein